MAGKYDDIMYMKHPEPTTRPRMPVRERAAQFAPFAALVGFEDSLEEVRRQTSERIELSSDEAAVLNGRIARLAAGDLATVLFFAPDARKEGGAYLRRAGRVRRVDEANRVVEFCDGARVPIDDLADVRLPDEPQQEDS